MCLPIVKHQQQDGGRIERDDGGEHLVRGRLRDEANAVLDDATLKVFVLPAEYRAQRYDRRQQPDECDATAYVLPIASVDVVDRGDRPIPVAGYRQ